MGLGLILLVLVAGGAKHAISFVGHDETSVLSRRFMKLQDKCTRLERKKKRTTGEKNRLRRVRKQLRELIHQNRVLTLDFGYEPGKSCDFDHDEEPTVNGVRYMRAYPVEDSEEPIRLIPKFRRLPFANLVQCSDNVEIHDEFSLSTFYRVKTPDGKDVFFSIKAFANGAFWTPDAPLNIYVEMHSDEDSCEYLMEEEHDPYF
jgi:hypothetical protein